MKYRPHRGGLDEAMEECVDLPDTLEALEKHLAPRAWQGFDPKSVNVERYGGPDKRIGWEETCMVTVVWDDVGRAPIGFTDALPNPGVSDLGEYERTGRYADGSVWLSRQGRFEMPEGKGE